MRCRLIKNNRKYREEFPDVLLLFDSKRLLWQAPKLKKLVELVQKYGKNYVRIGDLLGLTPSQIGSQVNVMLK